MTQAGSGAGAAHNASIVTSGGIPNHILQLHDQVARLRGKVEKQEQQLADSKAALAAAEADLAEQERTT